MPQTCGKGGQGSSCRNVQSRKDDRLVPQHLLWFRSITSDPLLWFPQLLPYILSAGFPSAIRSTGSLISMAGFPIRSSHLSACAGPRTATSPSQVLIHVQGANKRMSRRALGTSFTHWARPPAPSPPCHFPEL